MASCRTMLIIDPGECQAWPAAGPGQELAPRGPRLACPALDSAEHTPLLMGMHWFCASAMLSAAAGACDAVLHLDGAHSLPTNRGLHITRTRPPSCLVVHVHTVERQYVDGVSKSILRQSCGHAFFHAASPQAWCCPVQLLSRINHLLTLHLGLASCVDESQVIHACHSQTEFHAHMRFFICLAGKTGHGQGKNHNNISFIRAASP